MTKVSIGVLPAAEFEIARELISALSAHLSYDDWLDCRYGTFMGRSLGGEDAHLVAVRLRPFLNWCDVHGLGPSESALDEFALESERDEDASQAVESSTSSLRRSIQSTERKARSTSLSHGP
jgi:hypothetical protein